MKKVLFFLSFILLLSCKNSDESNKLKFPNSELKRVSFLEKDFYVPSRFENASLDSIFQNRLSYSDTTDDLYLNKLRYEELLKSNSQFEYFIDKSNPNNTITFILGEYIALNENVLGLFAEMLQNRDISEVGNERRLIEKKFYDLSYADVVKVRFRYSNDLKKSYITQYLISQNSKTVTMIVTNSENEDYDQLIKNFSL